MQELYYDIYMDYLMLISFWQMKKLKPLLTCLRSHTTRTVKQTMTVKLPAISHTSLQISFMGFFWKSKSYNSKSETLLCLVEMNKDGKLTESKIDHWWLFLTGLTGGTVNKTMRCRGHGLILIREDSTSSMGNSSPCTTFWLMLQV